MEVVIREELPRRLVGLDYVGKNENQEIHRLWDAFIPRFQEVAGIKDTFGAMRTPKDAEPGVFCYLACREVANFDAIPEGMTGWEIEGGLFAIVACLSLNHIREGINAFYSEWLPASVYRARGCTLEYYPPSFPGRDEIELWFAIAPK